MRRALLRVRRWLGQGAQPGPRFAIFTALTLAFTWRALSTAGGFNEFRDAQLLWTYEDVARRTVGWFGELPIWNPYICGGVYALGGPQTRFVSPTFLLSLVFGTTRAEALTVFSMVLLALEGTFRYLRARGAIPSASLLAAPVFGMSGYFITAPALGWFNFLGFALLPWALVGARRAASGDVKGAALGAVAIAWAMGMGGTYTVPMIAIAMALELAQWVAARRAVPSLWGLVSLGAMATGLAAVRLMPVLDELQRSPRMVGGGGGASLGNIAGGLFGYWPPFAVASWYLVGLPAGVLSAFALLRRRSLPVAVVFVVWAWLALGYGVRFSLFAVLKQLPVFSMLRAPERFVFPAGLLVALGAAWSMSHAFARLRRPRRWPRLQLAGAGVAVLALGVNVGLLLFNAVQSTNGRTLSAPPNEEQRVFHQARGNRWSTPLFAAMSRGSIACHEAYPVQQSPLLRGDLADEWALVDGSAGSVRGRSWTPRRIELDVEVRRATRLRINQNHHHGWRTNVGTVVSDDGLLAVELEPGSHRLALSFMPRSFVAGAFASGLALIAVILAWRGRLQRRSVWAMAMGLPVLCAAMGLPSKSDVIPRLKAPSGEEIIAGAPPVGAKPIAGVFEGGITLQAASIELREDKTAFRLELDWATEPEVRKDLGFFVHIEPFDGKKYDADHPLISGALAVEAAPPGKTLRDILWIDVPPALVGKPCNVWVGVWALRTDAARMKVLASPHVGSNADRLHVGWVAHTPP